MKILQPATIPEQIVAAVETHDFSASRAILCIVLAGKGRNSLKNAVASSTGIPLAPMTGASCPFRSKSTGFLKQDSNFLVFKPADFQYEGENGAFGVVTRRRRDEHISRSQGEPSIQQIPYAPRRRAGRGGLLRPLPRGGRHVDVEGQCQRQLEQCVELEPHLRHQRLWHSRQQRRYRR